MRHVFHQFGRCRRWEFCTGTAEVTVIRVKSGLKSVHGPQTTIGRLTQKVVARMYPYLATPTPSNDPVAAAFTKLGDVSFGRKPGLFSSPYRFTADRKFPGQIIVHDEVGGGERRIERNPKGWLAIYDDKLDREYGLPRTHYVVREITQVRQLPDGRVGSYWQIAELDGFVRPPLQ